MRKWFLTLLLLFLIPLNCWAVTEFTCTVIPAGGGDYSTLAAWEAAINCNLTISSVTAGGLTRGAFADGVAIKQTTTEATGTSLHDTATQMLITTISGSPNSTDTWYPTADGNDTTNAWTPSGSYDTARVIANCSGATADTTAVTIAGWTTGASNYIEVIGDYICPASGNMYSESYYRIEVTNAIIIIIDEKYTRFTKIQTKLSGNWDRKNLHYSNLSATQEHKINGCIFLLATTGGDCQNIDTNDSDIFITISNSVFMGVTAGTTQSIRNGWSNGGNITLYNCTISGFDVGVEARVAGDTITVKNCAVFRNGDDFLQTAGTLTIDYCASDDGDGTNAVDWANEATDWANVFVDYANGDFHLNNFNGIGKIIDMGTDLSAIFTTDIDGDTRTVPWDIGADEYVSEAEPPSGARRRQVIINY